MRGLMIDPRLGKMVSELAGVDGMRIWHDQVFDQAALGQPDGLAFGQSLLVLLVARRHHHLGGAG